MYEVSAEYSQNIAKTVRESRIYGQIRTKSGNIYEITNDDISLGSLQILSKLNGSGDFRPGGVYSSELSMALPNFGETSKDLNGARVVLFYDLFRTVGGEEYDRVPLGLFWVDGSSIKRKFKAVSFKAYDNMLNFEFDTVELTDTLFNLLVYACTACGMALVTTQEQFEALPNGTITATINTARIQTWRDLLMFIGLATSSFVRCTRTGAIEVVPLTATRTEGGVIVPVRTIIGDLRGKTEFSDDAERVIKLIMRRGGKVISSSLNVTLTGAESGSTMELMENPLFAALTDDDVQAALNAALTPLVYCINRAFSATIANGDPALDVGDYIRLTGGAVDTERGYATGMITYSVWRYRAGHTIKCVLPTSVAREQSAVMALADTETTMSVRTPPKSQLEKRVDALEAAGSGGGTAEKLQTGEDTVSAETAQSEFIIRDRWNRRIANIKDSETDITINYDPYGDVYGTSEAVGDCVVKISENEATLEAAKTTTMRVTTEDGVIRSQKIGINTLLQVSTSGIAVAGSWRNQNTGAWGEQSLSVNLLPNDIGADLVFFGGGSVVGSSNPNVVMSFRLDGVYINGKKVLTEE